MREKATFGYQCGEGDLEAKLLIVVIVRTFAIGLQNPSIIVTQREVVLLHERPDAQDEKHVILDNIFIAQLLAQILIIWLFKKPVYALLNASRVYSCTNYSSGYRVSVSYPSAYSANEAI